MPVSRYRAERSAVYVENHLPVKLENAAVYLYGQVVILGDLEPGQRIELENEKLLVWPVGMTWLLADRVCGYPDRADDSNEEYMENISEIRSRRIFLRIIIIPDITRKSDSAALFRHPTRDRPESLLTTRTERRSIRNR